MPTAKEIEFSRLLIAKGMLSRAEMQRHLDELEEQGKAGIKISLEELLLKANVISALELTHLKSPKKRVLHCSKCKTMYRAQEEDIGKKFKCKNCGTIVVVPVPGQVSLKSVKEAPTELKAPTDEIDTRKVLRKVPPMAKPTVMAEDAVEHPEHEPAVATALSFDMPMDEMTLSLGLDDPSAIPDADQSAPVKAPYATKPSVKGPKAEMTVMVDLDEDDDTDEPAIMITEAQEEQELSGPVSSIASGAKASASKVGPAIPPKPSLQPAKANSANTIGAKSPQPNLVEVDSDEDLGDVIVIGDEFVEGGNLVDAAQPTAKPTGPQSAAPAKPPGKPVEATIMLDLDDQDEEAEVEPVAKVTVPSPQPAKRISEPPKPAMATLPPKPAMATVPPAVKPAPVVVKPPEKKPVKQAESTIMLDLGDDAEEEVATTKPAPVALPKPVVIAKKEPLAAKPPVAAMPTKPPVAAKESPAVVAKSPDKKPVKPNEATIMLDLGDEEEEKKPAGQLPNLQVPAEEALEEWALTGYGADGSEAVKIESHIEKKPPQVHLQAPVEEVLEEWVLTGYGADGAEAVKIESHIEKKPQPKSDYLQVDESKALDTWATKPLEEIKPEAVTKLKPKSEDKAALPVPPIQLIKPAIVKPEAKLEKKLEKQSPPKPPKTNEATIMLDLDGDDAGSET